MLLVADRADAAHPVLSTGVERVRKPKSGAQIMSRFPSTCLAEVFSIFRTHYPASLIMNPAAALASAENETEPNALICIDCSQFSVSLSKPKDNESPPACILFGKV